MVQKSLVLIASLILFKLTLGAAFCIYTELHSKLVPKYEKIYPQYKCFLTPNFFHDQTHKVTYPEH